MVYIQEIAENMYRVSIELRINLLVVPKTLSKSFTKTPENRQEVPLLRYSLFITD